jgi:hypothetical protein
VHEFRVSIDPTLPAGPYCTSRVKLSVPVALPLVPVTVAVVEPVGVPPDVPPPPPPPPLVPPQLAINIRPAIPTISSANAVPERSRRFCVLDAKMTMASMQSSADAIAMMRGSGAAGCCRCVGASALGAVVETVSVVVAVVAVELRVADGGLKLQVAPVGNPVQANVTVPLKLPCAVTVAVIVPELPGAATVTVGLVEVRANSEAKLLIRLAALMVPRPVALSKPVPAEKPVRIPLASAEFVREQFGVPNTQGCAFVPTVTS